jgi:hypothetical protein
MLLRTIHWWEEKEKESGAEQRISNIHIHAHICTILLSSSVKSESEANDDDYNTHFARVPKRTLLSHRSPLILPTRSSYREKVHCVLLGAI